MYSNPWMYQDQEFDGPVKGLEGFIYLITNLTNNKRYIGKKHFWTRRKTKGSTRRVTKESDWRDYYSSSDDLKSDVEKFGKENFKREILHLCVYKKEMTFLEQKEQWTRDVLLTDDYYNTNIGGKFFVRERHIYYTDHHTKEITNKNDTWRSMASERMKGDGNIAKDPKVRAKISEKKRGEKHHQYGKPISENHKEKLHTSALKAVRRKIQDKDGNVFDTVTECLKSTNLNTEQFYKAINSGELTYLDGLPVKNRKKTVESRSEQSNRQSMEWLITFPEGHTENVKNLSKFCKERGLSNGSMCNLAQDKKSYYKGYRCTKI